METNNELTVFSSQQFGEVRTTMIDGQPWFVGKDVASVLGYADTVNALKRHVDTEDKGGCQIATPYGGKQNMTIINESGLYSLVLSSKLPTAKAFKRWITSEVLPTIRKHGAYMDQQTVERALAEPDFLIQLATNLKEERKRREELEAVVTQQKVTIQAQIPKVAFADSVSASGTSILVGELAKLLRQNGVQTGEKRLYETLRRDGYLISRKGSDWNTPTQRAMELGLFEIKETTINHSDGHITIQKTPKVTGKGQVYFINKYC